MAFTMSFKFRPKFIAAAAVILSIPSALAADYSVSGRVTTLADGEVCPGAIYRIYLATDTVTPAAFNVANDEGFFRQALPSSGDYIIKVEYTGMKTDLRNFSVSSDKPAIDLGIISLTPDDETLQEVVITAKKKLIESDGATLTYNVEEDPESSINNTIEMLRKVPMVTVDAEDNIKVNGNSNFKILINGKEDPMLSGDVKTILKSMPAATIKKIEVITEPGAKYDAEGTGGILNIITVGKQSLEGYLTNLSANVSTRNYGASAYARTKIRNITASANVNYSDAFHLGYINSQNTTIENLTSDENRYQYTEGKSKYTWNYLGGNFNLSWEPDTLNLFTLQGNIGKNNSDSHQKQSMWLENIDNDLQWSLKRDYTNDDKSLWLGANASYQHTFGKQGHHIVASYIFGYSSGNDDYYTMTYDLISYPEAYPWRLEESDSYGRRHTLQIDYANPLSDKHVLEAGFKGNWNNSYQKSNPWYGTERDNMEIRQSEAIDMMQFQDIMAAYISYGGSFGKWNVKAGVRYEHTRMGLKYFVGDYSDFTSYLNDVVPNAAISYKVGDAANIRLAYQMRIWRPGLWNLNPYRNTLTPNSVRYGNPNLDSEKNHGISLSYSNYGGKLGGSISVSYRREDNSITSYQFIEDNILNNTYANIGHSQTTSANLNLNWNIISMLNIGIYLSGSYDDFKANSPELTASSHNWQGNYNFNADYTFPFMLRLSVYAGGGTGWASLQTKASGYSYHGLSLSRSFLKEKALTVSLFGSNILTPYIKSHDTTESSTSISSSSGRFRSWALGASVSIRFGSLRNDVKRTAADLDMEQGSSQGGNSGTRGM
ncbi:MAG: TonB-dependent receptor [Bacteroides sp.]|nr:TonB-dependent receptor [Bacteroides sp.]